MHSSKHAGTWNGAKCYFVNQHIFRQHVNDLRTALDGRPLPNAMHCTFCVNAIFRHLNDTCKSQITFGLEFGPKVPSDVIIRVIDFTV